MTALRRLRRTKIVATLGPASSDRGMIEKLCRAGADVFRINMSHTSHEKLADYVASIRAVEALVGRPIGILVDLQGPKLRVGAFGGDGGAMLAEGDLFVLDGDTTPGDDKRVHLPHPEILTALSVGDTILIDDGKMRLRTVEVGDMRAVTRVEIGGRISSRKGVSLPDTTIATSAMTPKDRSDLDAALNQSIDWIALSFVQRPDDVQEVKGIARGRAAVLAKIEKPQAVARLAEIMDVGDALMVARGDLGVEMPLARLPGIQKQITRGARRTGDPVVVATQMLESMITSPIPTRAEVSDVATAIFEGADAVMLSAESAAGKYPVEAVATMDRIAIEVENDPVYRTLISNQRHAPEPTGADSIAAAARQIADTLDLAAVVCWTSSGSSAIRVARERPKSPIIALSPNIKTARKLTLVWGTHPVVAEDARDIDDMAARAASTAFQEGFARASQRIIIVAGVPFGTPGATNMLRLAFVGSTKGVDI
jgi:pyruvate kinase